MAILIGYLTPVASAILVSQGLNLSAISSGRGLWTQMTLVSIALLLLGPGAYSVDARLYGLRRIVIPEARPRPPG